MLYPYHIFYQAGARPEHLFALLMGDPVLGTVMAERELEAIELAQSQQMGHGRPVVATYLADGVPYRSVVTGRVAAKFPAGGGTLWYPFGYWEEPGYNSADLLDVKLLHLRNVLRAMEAQVSQIDEVDPVYERRMNAVKKHIRRLEQDLVLVLDAAKATYVIRVGEIAFRCGDNGQHLYYAHDARPAGGHYWCVFRPHLTPNMRKAQVKTYWAAHVESPSGSPLVLNFATRKGATTEYNVLYDHTDAPNTDPPLRLLTTMAALIVTGVDPWTIPPIVRRNHD
ncbi:MAG: hypothetical protein KKA73_18350 [Chloroflexi bacterium]|nr:hypothetical protein [Chloroflexota bacterium]MBU1749649.1 hypothetical protein [Chloroflexota bacterium]